MIFDFCIMLLTQMQHLLFLTKTLQCFSGRKHLMWSQEHMQHRPNRKERMRLKMNEQE